MINLLLLSAVTSFGGIVDGSDAFRTQLSPSIAGVSPSAVEDGWLTVRTTAYTHTEADHKKYGRKTACGNNLRFGTTRSAAADWSRFPVGTRFQIEDDPSIYIVEDYGSALVGNDTIDLYRPSRSSMNSWGVRHVRIRILEWGCFDRSLEIMKPRTFNRFVRSMSEKIKRDDTPVRRVLQTLLLER
jgi:3D (Asp-Asp-Asp) domain-containing protein